jgi:hypothetical protein
MKKQIHRAALVFAVLLFPSSLLAVPISGEVTFAGGFTPTGGTGLGDATGLEFSNVFVLDGTDDFADIPSLDADGALTPVTFTDFQFNPLSPAPVNPLWSIDGYGLSFSLASISVDEQTSTTISLSGMGLLTSTDSNLDDTAGVWNLTGNTTRGLKFAFSSASGPIGVPEANTIALLGIGLLGAGLSRRRRA